MDLKHVVILHGGAEESDISEISANYIYEQVKKISSPTDQLETKVLNINNFNNLPLLMQHLRDHYKRQNTYIIPCVHGSPGESGALPQLLAEEDYHYLGCDGQSSSICFNKITTKLWCQELGIPVTPFIVVSKNNYKNEQDRIKQFFHQHEKNVFIKTPTQGSSIGCYNITEETILESKLKESFSYNHISLIEKKIKGREIEVATFTYNGKLVISDPGEVITGGEFYDFEKKYSKTSDIKTKTNTILTTTQKEQIKKYSRIIFTELGLRDLSRVDFFLDESGGFVYLNEINTFPGMTPISMFPKMLESTGIKFKDFISDKLKNRS